MEFPYGHSSHHRHHHHGGRERDEEEYPPPPPPSAYPPYGNPPPPGPPLGPPYHGEPQPPPPHVRPPNYGAPPPPPSQAAVYHSSHVGMGGPGLYPPPSQGGVHHSSHTGMGGPEAYPPPPGRTVVEHVAHHGGDSPHHHGRPHLPSGVHHHSHHGGEFSNKPSVRVYTKAETNYSLSIRDGKVILARSDPSDPHQHWIKDEKFSTKVKDEEGLPSFALVNKATGQAMKHSIGATHPVQLIPYNPDVLDESILWTFSKDLGDSYNTIRMVNNIRLNVDAFHGDKNHGGVHDGTTIVLWEWAKGDNQRWKIVPYYDI